MDEWLRMPTAWITRIDSQKLHSLKWIGEHKSDYTASLMVYIALIHHTNDKVNKDFSEPGYCKLTYSVIGELTSLSRSKISRGLNILYDLGLVSKSADGKNSCYQMIGYNLYRDWGKIPAKGLYSSRDNRIKAFKYFTLRNKTELNALKIYLVIIAFRSNKDNYATIGYQKLVEYSGIQRNDIKSALSLLTTLNLIQVDSVNSQLNEFSTCNTYRLCFLEVYRHKGTTGKA
jgi:DNA-binding transcriptional ArsR family regulator